MASYVTFQLEDGTTVYIETTDTPKGSSGLIPGGRGEHTEQSASTSFEKSIGSVRKVASAMIEGLRSESPDGPEEIQINFGLKGSADLGALVVARGGVEANFSVMLRWRAKRNDETEEGGGEEVSKPKKAKKSEE